MSANPTAVPPTAAPIETLNVGASLTIYTVETSAAAWTPVLVRGRAVVLDLGNVRECDTLGIQLLVAARRRAADAGASLRLAGVGPVITAAATAVGCDTLLASLVGPNS